MMQSSAQTKGIVGLAFVVAACCAAFSGPIAQGACNAEFMGFDFTFAGCNEPIIIYVGIRNNALVLSETYTLTWAMVSPDLSHALNFSDTVTIPAGEWWWIPWNTGVSLDSAGGWLYSVEVLEGSNFCFSEGGSFDSVGCLATPSAPSSLSATNGTYCNKVRITWNSVSCADYYKLYRDGQWLTDWSQTSYDDFPGDSNNHSYKVKACGFACGCSGFSNSDTGYRKAAPSAPTTASASPSDGAQNVSASANLNWANASGATSYDVYFGTDSTPDSGEFKGNTGSSNWNLGALAEDTTYYWRINPKNSCGTTTGPVWSFTTTAPCSSPSQPSSPIPNNGAQIVSTSANLDWANASGATSYDVYFGTNSSPPFQGNTGSSDWNLGTLAEDTTHYWRIDPKNSCGTTTGPVWSFRTSSSPPPPDCFVSPTSLNFGTVQVGSSVDRSFTITNNGGGTLSGSVSESCSDYSIISGGGSYNLGAGQSRSVTVRFSPSSSGTKTCTINTGTDCADVSCTGVGDEPQPVCFVSPTSLDFGTVEIGSSADRTFTITNTGTGTLSDFVYISCSYYEIISGADSYSLGAGQSRSVTVRFFSTSAGTKTCTISTGTNCTDVSCTGIGNDLRTRGACCYSFNQCNLNVPQANCTPPHVWQGPDTTSCANCPPEDTDGDGVLDPEDNCPDTPNTDQADLDGDGEGDVCDQDADGDGLLPKEQVPGSPAPGQQFDCDDLNSSITSELEICDDGIDNDCDGLTDASDTDCSGPDCVEFCGITLFCPASLGIITGLTGAKLRRRRRRRPKR